MDARTIALARRVDRELRYRTLTDMIGRHVVVASLDAISVCVRGLAAAWLPASARWRDPTEPSLALAKYGIIDAVLDAPLALLDDARTLVGIPVLRAVGRASRRGEPLPGDEKELDDDEKALMDALDEMDCITDLAADLDRRECLLKVFLTSTPPGHEPMQRVARRPALRAGFFPRDFVVADACVTNARSIWLAKHLYL